MPFGFRTLRIGTTPAELQVWYPASSNQGPKVTCGDYMRVSQDLRGSKPGFGRDSAALRKTLRVAVMGHDGPLADKLCDEILAMPSAAHARTLLLRLKTGNSLKFTSIPDDHDVSHIPAWVKTAKQTTDGHLIQLAKAKSAILATLDERIPGAFLIPTQR